jgi:hypothetical protein
MIAPCPIAPCPITACQLSLKEVQEDDVLPIGTFLESPGKSYVYQVLSAPLKRTYLDFKGLFDRPMKASEILGIVSADIVTFYTQYQRGQHIILPSVGRMFWVFLATLLTKNGMTPHWLLNHKMPLSPFRLLPHLTESNPNKKGVTGYHTYRVNVFYRNFDGVWIKGKNPTVLTLRWTPIIIEIFDYVS